MTSGTTADASVGSLRQEYRPQWIELDGLANLRDVGGLPTADGARTRNLRLLRSDNLQSLTPASIRWLLDAGLSDVIDLRSDRERAIVGPSPLEGTGVVIHPLSLLPEGSAASGVVAGAVDGADLIGPGELAHPTDHATQLVREYLLYLMRRPDSVVAALRAIGGARGAALVHCAAGKDRTGTIVALALSVVGVPEDLVVADYAASNERLEQVNARLRSSEPYASDMEGQPVEDQLTPAVTMTGLLAEVRRRFGGVPEYLASHGWTDADTASLRTHLLG